MTLLALVPAFLLALFVWFKNPAGKRPVTSLGMPLLLGIAAVVIALIFAFITPMAGEIENTMLGFIISNFVLIAVSEEGSKMLGLVLMEKKRKIVVPYDALIFGAVIGLGFGGFENCLYLMDIDAVSALLRALFSVPGHIAYGVLMGSFFAIAVAEGWKGNASARRRNLVLAFIVPWALHGTYDFLLDLDMMESALALDAASIAWAFASVFARSRDPRMTMIAPQQNVPTAFPGAVPQQPVPQWNQPQPPQTWQGAPSQPSIQVHPQADPQGFQQAPQQLAQPQWQPQGWQQPAAPQFQQQWQPQPGQVFPQQPPMPQPGTVPMAPQPMPPDSQAAQGAPAEPEQTANR